MKSQGSVEYATVKDVVITETKEGIKEWEVYAAVAEYDSKKVVAMMTDIVGNYYKDGKVVMSFISNNGKYISNEKRVELYGAVKVVGEDNMKLTADKIYWITNEEKVHAEGNVIINKNNEAIALSDKASVTKDLKFVEIQENTELRIYKEFKNKKVGQ